jgi:hypothetical protein
MTADAFAASQLANANNNPNISAKAQMASKKIANYDGHEVFYYIQNEGKWYFKYIFQAEDNRVHYIQVIVKDNTDKVVESIPESWSLNQNNSDKKAATTEDESADDADDATNEKTEESAKKESAESTQSK